MKTVLIISGLGLCLWTSCSSDSSFRLQSPPSQSAPLFASFVTVRNPTRILCIDDTFSRTEWFNQPVVWFSGAEIKLLDRVVTKQELREWAEKYYQRKAERALAVQIAPNSMAKAEDALSPLIQAIPDLRIYHVEYGFTCAKGRRAD